MARQGAVSRILAVALAVAVVLAFLSVIPEGNLLLPLPLSLLLFLPSCLSFPKGIRFSANPTPCYHSAMPPREYHFWVYILSSRSRNLYIGVTNNLTHRTLTHRKEIPGAHTAKYAIHRLVYFEYFQYIRSAIAREKALKHFTRQQKIELIEKKNPTWEDLLPKLQAEALSLPPKADSLRE